MNDEGKRNKLAFFVVFLLLIYASCLHAERTTPTALELLQECQKSFETVQDYTAVFIKRQRVQNRLRKSETIFVKFKKPFCVYMKWLKNPDEGKEVIYIQGKNGDKLAAHPGGLLNILTPTLHLSPQNPLAMVGNLKPITEAGLGKAIDSLLYVCHQAQKTGDLFIELQGEKEFEGKKVYVIERLLPEEKGYPNHRAVIYVDPQHMIPVYYAGFNKQGDLLEEYIYRNVQLNVGLREVDFDVKNPQYDYTLF